MTRKDLERKIEVGIDNVGDWWAKQVLTDMLRYFKMIERGEVSDETN